MCILTYGQYCILASKVEYGQDRVELEAFGFDYLIALDRHGHGRVRLGQVLLELLEHFGRLARTRAPQDPQLRKVNAQQGQLGADHVVSDAVAYRKRLSTLETNKF